MIAMLGGAPHARQPPLKLVRLDTSPLATKKWRAVWSDGRHTDFGAAGYSDYTIHKDAARRARYRMRHARDRLDDPRSPGALSWYVLWGDSTSLRANMRAFKARFGV